MKDKIAFKLNMPENNTYILIIGILSIVILFHNIYVGIFFFLMFGYIVFHNWKVTNIRRREWTKYIETLSLDIDETTKQAMLNLPIPLCILEFDGSITWYNNKFLNIIDKKDMLGMNIEDIVPNINLRKALNESKELYTDLEYKDKNYTIVYNIIKSDQGSKTKYVMMLYWIDKTEYLDLVKKYNDEKNVMALIQVDGYDDVMQSAREEMRPILSAEIEKILKNWESSLGVAINKTSRDKHYYRHP